MCVGSIKWEVLNNFVEECAGIIQLEGIGTFWLKIVYDSIFQKSF